MKDWIVGILFLFVVTQLTLDYMIFVYIKDNDQAIHRTETELYELRSSVRELESDVKELKSKAGLTDFDHSYGFGYY